MIAVNFKSAWNRFGDFCAGVSNSAERCSELEKAERNAAYLGKLERGLAQVHAGQGIAKTMDELEALAEDGT